MISIHIYPSSYVWRTAIVHSKNGNRTFVVQFGSSKNPLGCFRSCVTPINISLLSGWLVLNKHGFPKRKEVIPNDDVISLWAWGWGDPPLWSRCDSEAPSLLESRVTSLCLFVERILPVGHTGNYLGADPICKPAPNSSDRRLSIDDTMPSLVEVMGTYQARGCISRCLLYSVRPGSGKTWRASPGRDSPWQGSKLQAAPIASKVMKFLLPRMMNYRGLPSSSPLRHCPETECLKRLESPWLDGRDLISWHGRYSWVVPAEGSEFNCTVV